MSEVAATAEAAPKRKPGVNLIIMVVVALVLLGGGGGALYFFTGHKKDAAAAKTTNKESAKPKAPAVYVKMDPPFVANFEAKGLMRFLQVTVEIMTRDPLIADLLKQHDPMIRNDLLMLFGNQKYEDISTHEGKDKLRAEALASVRKIVGGEGGDGKKVEQLYFTSFVMQ